MRLKIDISHNNIRIFNTEEEFRIYIAPMIKTPKESYLPQPKDLHPEQFPCAMIYDDRIICRLDGNDEFPNYFIYDFEVLDD